MRKRKKTLSVSCGPDLCTSVESVTEWAMQSSSHQSSPKTMRRQNLPSILTTLMRPLTPSTTARRSTLKALMRRPPIRLTSPSSRRFSVQRTTKTKSSFAFELFTGLIRWDFNYIMGTHIIFATLIFKCTVEGQKPGALASGFQTAITQPRWSSRLA